MLGLLHLLIWLKNRQNTAYLLSALMAFSITANALIELAMLHTGIVDGYVTLMKWENVAIYGLLITLIGFVYLYFQTARRWLAITITALWSLALCINFLSPGSIVFIEAIQLRT